MRPGEIRYRQKILLLDHGCFFFRPVAVRGAFVNAKDAESKTVLLPAIENDRPDIAELLISNGANVNFADSEGNTPLMIAAQKSRKSVVKLLLSEGANPNT